MKLIVGLGNPGREYVNTRHNIGFLALDAFLDSLPGGSFSENNKFRSSIATADFMGNKIILAKPLTFMNLSGQAVQLISHYYKILSEDVVVLHDDIDLPLGEVKIKQGGGHAGHNGLRSIDNAIGKNYYRIRLGVGRPDTKEEVSNYVLSNFSKKEEDIVKEMLSDIKNNISFIIS